MRTMMLVLTLLGAQFLAAQELPLKSGTVTNHLNNGHTYTEQMSFQSQRIVDYQLVYSQTAPFMDQPTFEQFNNKVRAMIKQGWVPVGPVVLMSGYGFLMQTMIRYE